MAILGDRISGYIEGVSERWKDRLRGWMLRTISEGVTKFAEDLEPGAIEGYQKGITSLRDNPLIPEELRAFYDKALKPGNPISAVGATLVMVLQSFGVLLGGSAPLANLFAYEQDKLLQSFRLDPQSVITAWRRNPELGAAFFEDLKEQGWTEPRIEVLKLVTQFYPSAQDLVTWLAREVFEPDQREKYGLDDEAQFIDPEIFAKAGVSMEQALNYWRAHWEHTSLMQMMELLHRGLLTGSREVPPEPATPEEWAKRDRQGIEEMYNWYRLVEITPYWRNLITEALWNVPTRVDVRRWWDMRVITEQELYSIYHRQGYHGKDLENYVNWTKVYTDFPYWLSRWQKGWVTEQEVRDWLRSLKIPEDRIEIFIQDKIKPETPARVEAELTLTKSEIYKGVKQGKITREEGVGLLIDIGNNRAEAEYLLDINIPPEEVDAVVEERKLSKADIKAALASELITEVEARSKLAELNYSSANIDLLIRIFQAAIKPPEEEKLKQASKADIVEGVKKGVISPEEGYGMLTDIGFSPEASNFILTIKAEESPFSPTNFTEFQDLTTKWRQAVGKEATPVTEQLKQAGAEVIRLGAEVDALRNATEDEEAKLIPDQPLPEEATKRLKELEVALHRAEAELAAAQDHYKAVMAEWRQKE